MGYPDTPGHKGIDTSADAAAAVAPSVREKRIKVLAEIRQAGLRGLTADEVARRLNESVLAIRPRVSELHTRGTIEPTGERRTNASGLGAAVWRVAPLLTTHNAAEGMTTDQETSS